ncbi:MAG TPA: DUF2254 domain-containing protein, partial [Deinococcales bacterium]|nr:DUF2254 domain-containing protein [Deinococcales bacterium]
MNAHVAAAWDALRSSLWLIPALMTLAAGALSAVTLALDGRLRGAGGAFAWVYSGSAEGARSVLATIAGSMMTVTGTTFSITVAALTLASSQFGPRLLRNFMRDRGNQVVLGTFIATFVYCLLVLRMVRGGDGDQAVPHLSVTVGVLLSLLSLGALIYFIHHVAMSMQAAHVIANVGRDLDRAIEELFPQQVGREREVPAAGASGLPAGFEEEAVPVAVAGSGYVQALDNGALMRLAVERDLVLRVEARPGDFRVSGAPLVLAWPPERAGGLERAVNAAFAVGMQRTQAQDVEYGINQLVEIAVRALSPGVNDPFTAVACVDRLSDTLVRLARQPEPSAWRHDPGGRLRIVAHPYDFVSEVRASFNQIRQYGRGSAAVSIRLLESLAAVAGAACRARDLEELA